MKEKLICLGWAVASTVMEIILVVPLMLGFEAFYAWSGGRTFSHTYVVLGSVFSYAVLLIYERVSSYYDKYKQDRLKGIEDEAN